MAQDKVQTIPAQPSRAQQTPTPDSPYYDASNMPENTIPAARWLFGLGWRCIGDPSWEMTQWYAPGALDYETTRKEPRMGRVMRIKGKTDAMGHPVAESVVEQLKQQDGSTLAILNVPIEQLVVTPPAAPMSFREAVRNQQIRDEKVRRDAQKNARQSA